MSLSRRTLLLSGISGFALSACATNLSKYGNTPVPELAKHASICHAAYVTLRGGVASAPVVIDGCNPSATTGPDSILQAASLTKPAIAFLALELARAGTLDLQAPVSRYLPEGYQHLQNPFSKPNDGRSDTVSPETLARIPVATLLNHSSGLPNWSNGVLAPEFEPGQRWQYSGEGYLLLQAVITAATGADIETLMSRHVFEPLGMHDSRMRLTEDIRGRVVSGTGWLGRSTHFEFIEPNAAASMYTTAGDYAKLLAAIASRRDLQSLIVSAPIPVDQELGLSWGYGWGIEDAAGGPYLWQWAITLVIAPSPCCRRPQATVSSS